MMPREVIEGRLPKLQADPYRITSPHNQDYNCVAWVARDIEHWWEPEGFDGSFWPLDASEDGGLGDYVRLFSSIGFEGCAEIAPEAGYEKIAIYGTSDEFSHVAFQLDGGEWSSKLGQGPDIRHDLLESLGGTGPFEFGDVLLVMRRPREPHPLAESGLLRP